MHGGEHHGPVPETTNPSHVGIDRPIYYPIQYSVGDRVKCATTGHVVTFVEVMEFDTKEELQTYVCDCIVNKVNVTPPVA